MLTVKEYKQYQELVEAGAQFIPLTRTENELNEITSVMRLKDHKNFYTLHPLYRKEYEHEGINIIHEIRINLFHKDNINVEIMEGHWDIRGGWLSSDDYDLEINEIESFIQETIERGIDVFIRETWPAMLEQMKLCEESRKLYPNI